MEMTRRTFAKSIAGTLAFLASGISLIQMAACNVWSELQAWVPAGIAAFESVVLLVAPVAAPGIDLLAESVKAGFAAVAAAVNQYLNAPAAQKATLGEKVRLVLSQLGGDIQAFLDAVKLSSTSPIIKIVLGLITIIISTISGFVSRIGVAPASVNLRMGSMSVMVVPVFRDRKQFKNDFNGACVANGHPELQIN